METNDLTGPGVHPDVLPIYPDDDAPIHEGYKVRVPDGAAACRAYAFFPDTAYGSSEGSLRAADAWARRGEIDPADTRNVVRVEIQEKTACQAGCDGAMRIVKARRATSGWQVRMTREATAYSRFFSDTHFGGREGALAAAQHWRDARDATLTRVDPQTALDRSRATRSQFGVPGLRLLLIDVGNGRHVPYLQASWPAGSRGRRKRTSLSLAKHDPREATVRLCQLLVEARGLATLPAGGEWPPAGDDAPVPMGFAGGVTDATEREALMSAFAEAYRRAWPVVHRELPSLRRKARARTETPQATGDG